MRVKQNISVLFRLLIAVSIVSLMAACNLIYEDCSKCALTEPVEIGFTISTGMFSFPATKAPVYGDEDGQNDENYIGIESGDFMFLFFDENGKYLQTFQPDPEDITPIGGIPGVSPNPDPTGDPMPVNQVYYISGKLNEAYTDFTMVALLNYGGVNGRYPIGEDVAAIGETPDLIVGTSTLDDLISNNVSGGWGIFNYNPTTIPYAPSQTTPIPMYGVRKFENVLFRDNILTDLGEINVIRAYAKIRVRLSDTFATLLDLSAVTLKRFSTVAYKAPNIIETTPRSVTATTEQYCSSAQISSDSIPFRKINNDLYEIYVPAFNNVNAPANEKSTITVKLSNGKTYTDAIHFAYYDDNGRLPANPTYFNILRNQIIDYKITGISGADLTLELEANPWVIKTESYQYEQLSSFETGGFPTFDPTTIKEIDASDKDNGNVYVIMKQDNTFAKVTFTVATPTGGTWNASLVRKDGLAGAFSFVTEGGTTIEALSGPVGQPATLYIKKNLPQPAAIHNEYVLRLMVTFPPPVSVTIKVNYLEIEGGFGSAKEYTIVQPAS